MTPKLAVIVCDWDDAWVRAEAPATMSEVAVEHKPEPVTTLGWVLKDDDVGISLANEYYDGTWRGRTFIPRVMIKSVTYYKLTKAKTGGKLKTQSPLPHSPEPSSA